MRNPELQLIRSVRDTLEALTITLSDGGTETFTIVGVGEEEQSAGYPQARIVPMGPQFLTGRLGPQTINRKVRHVGIVIEIHYEHHDREAGVETMSDILWATVEAILENPRLGGAESIEIGEVDYAYTVTDKDKDFIPDFGYKGVALIPIAAEYRYK